MFITLQASVEQPQILSLKIIFVMPKCPKFFFINEMLLQSNKQAEIIIFWAKFKANVGRMLFTLTLHCQFNDD